MALTINKDTIVEENTIGKSKNEMNSICLRIIPILLYCQANKGDLSMYETWKNSEDAGKKLFFDTASGRDWPKIEELRAYALVLHCGACMTPPAELSARIADCRTAGVPVVNYGVALALLQGVELDSLDGLQ